MDSVFLAAAAPALTEISLTGIVILIVNILLLVAVGIIGGSVRRLVRQNDQQHADLGAAIAAQKNRVDDQIEKLTAAIAAEREARHEFHRTLDTRVWDVHADVVEHYAKNETVLRLFGSLSQRLASEHQELMAKIDELPCRKPACPAKDGGEHV